MQTALKTKENVYYQDDKIGRLYSVSQDHIDNDFLFEELPDGTKRFTYSAGFTLEKGGFLPEIDLIFETWGKLNDNKSNAIIIHHALSVGSHASSTPKKPDAGWWQEMVGPGKAIDTSKYYVICINNLGSCFGSTGPTSINPKTSKRYKYDFPKVTIGDMVRSQKLLMDKLGIHTLYGVVGSSMGAMLSLTWAVEHLDSLENLILISSSYKAYPANIANRYIQHQAIKMDPMWQMGNYNSNQELLGFKLARKLGLYGYKNSNEWNSRFNSHQNSEAKDADIINYFDYNADKFCNNFDANSYLILTQSMDLYDITQNYSSLKACFSKITAKTLVVSVDSDILFTPQQQEELHCALQEGGVDSAYINHHSQYGHDAFLVEKEPFAQYIDDFLSDHKQSNFL